MSAPLPVRPLTVRTLIVGLGVAKPHGRHPVNRTAVELRLLALIGIGCVIVVAAIAFVSLYTMRRRRTLPGRSQLPGLPDDWWPSFEREFRAYARRVARPEHKGQRRGGGPGRR